MALRGRTSAGISAMLVATVLVAVIVVAAAGTYVVFFSPFKGTSSVLCTSATTMVASQSTSTILCSYTSSSMDSSSSTPPSSMSTSPSSMSTSITQSSASSTSVLSSMTSQPESTSGSSATTSTVDSVTSTEPTTSTARSSSTSDTSTTTSTYLGTFTWSLTSGCPGSATQTCTVEGATGTFMFTVDPNSGVIAGNGQGTTTQTDTGNCQGSGSSLYMFTVNGAVSGYNVTSWGFATPTPDTFTYTDTCYPPYQSAYTMQVQASFISVYPIQWDITGQTSSGSIPPWQYTITINFSCTPSIPVCALYH